MELKGFANRSQNEPTHDSIERKYSRDRAPANYTDYILGVDGRLEKPSVDKKKSKTMKRKPIKRTHNQLTEGTEEAEHEALSPHLMDVRINTT